MPSPSLFWEMSWHYLQVQLLNFLPITNLTSRNSFLVFAPKFFHWNSTLFFFFCFITATSCEISLLMLSVVVGPAVYILFHSLDHLFPQESAMFAFLSFCVHTVNCLHPCLPLGVLKSRSWDKDLRVTGPFVHHPYIEGHLSWFQLLAITNKAEMSIPIEDLVWT